MNQALSFLLSLLLTAQAIHFQSKSKATILGSGAANLIADNGQYLRICHNCIQAKPDVASIQPSTSDNTTLWTLQPLPGDKVAFKGSNGLYLSRCNGCWVGSTLPDSAFVYANDSSAPSSQWTPVRHPNGKFSFLSNNGKYLSRCDNCINSNVSRNFAFVDETNPLKDSAQWTIVYQPLLKEGTVKLKTDLGFLRLCFTCDFTSHHTVSIENFDDLNTKWQLTQLGGKILLKGSNGKYLARCIDECLKKDGKVDSVAAYVTNTADLAAQWMPIKLSNGKWSLKADNGKFLTATNRIAYSIAPSMAFANATSNSQPSQQFTINYV